ncbi:uncharacterized protein LOC108734596 [Agrilus planipennis]|uniref:Uncharacterized protein LOC108734596 n=1 Tax=Agrilus planipennis TaxID=224129 RepID=A0A1W4WNP5_AGRPL|nr:uncharacterized protein LOC108734596 [Agrilus planipennis]
MQRKWYLLSPKNPQARHSNTSKSYKEDLDGNRSSASSLTLTEEEVDNVVLVDEASYISACRKTPDDDKDSTTGDSNTANGTESNSNNVNDAVKSNLKLIDDVINNVLALQYEIVSFSGSQEDKKYLYLEDAMVKYLVLLDSIESNNNEDVRFKRKEAVFLIQQHIDLLDAKTTENIRNRLVANSRDQELGSQGQNAQWSNYRGEPLHPRQRTTIQDMLPDNWKNYTTPYPHRQNVHNQNTIFNHWEESGNSQYPHVPMEIDEDDTDFEL